MNPQIVQSTKLGGRNINSAKLDARHFGGGAPPFSFVAGATAPHAGVTTVDIAAPSGMLENDYLILAHFHCQSSAGAGNRPAFSAPTSLPSGSAWAASPIQIALSANDFTSCRLWGKKAGASEPATYTVAWTGGNTYSGFLVIGAFRCAGAYTTAVFEFAQQVNALSPATAIVAPGFADGVKNDLLVCVFSGSDGANGGEVITKPASMTLIGAGQPAGDFSHVNMAYEALVVDGVTGTRSGTYATTTTQPNFGQSLILRAA